MLLVIEDCKSRCAPLANALNVTEGNAILALHNLPRVTF